MIEAAIKQDGLKSALEYRAIFEGVQRWLSIANDWAKVFRVSVSESLIGQRSIELVWEMTVIGDDCDRKFKGCMKISSTET